MFIYICIYFIYQTKARGVELYICNASCLTKQQNMKTCSFPGPQSLHIVAPYCHPSTPSSMVTAGNQGDWSFKYPPRRSIALCSGMFLWAERDWTKSYDELADGQKRIRSSE